MPGVLLPAGGLLSDRKALRDPIRMRTGVLFV